MNIQTERCVIRAFRPEDIDSFMAYRNDDQWMLYQGYKGKDRQTYERDLLEPEVFLSEGRQLAIAKLGTGQLIGDVYLKQAGDVYWIGYTIHPSYARQGYASEAVAALIKWVSQRGGAAIKAGVLPGNAASIALLEKLHFTYEGQSADELIYAFATCASTNA